MPDSPETTERKEPSLLDALGRLENEMERRKEFWRTVKDDPHGIAEATMVACCEMKEAIRIVIKEITVR